MNPIVAPVKNVVRAQISFNRLYERPMGVPAIALWHGDSGRGKSTAATHIYNQLEGVYISVRSADTVTSLTRRMVEECGGEPLNAKSRNIEYIIRHLSLNNTPLFIDEADYLMNKNEMLDTVRDIYDATEVPMVLIGMNKIARRIESNRQFFNRISEWVEFKAADLEDVKTVANCMMDDQITIEEELLERLRKSTNGEMRRIVIGINKIISLANANELLTITSRDWGDAPFHGY
ncbi:AAA family ATPase [Thaumasiovibrio subtropicus]|uniref:AAA family ATPase n=1 Tax=Thaumasiovibrio subtropicus TaxID=1891207 RepID=UPI000B359869|nr:ATP-binding protein [Thaumasiovibrio subtropicus]